MSCSFAPTTDMALEDQLIPNYHDQSSNPSPTVLPTQIQLGQSQLSETCEG